MNVCVCVCVFGYLWACHAAVVFSRQTLLRNWFLHTACVHKDMQTHADTFLSSLHQQLHSSSHCSAAYQCFCFRQVWQWHFDQWLVHHPSPAHWKETVVHTLPTVKIIILTLSTNYLSSDIRIPVPVSSRSGLQSMQEQSNFYTTYSSNFAIWYCHY